MSRFFYVGLKYSLLSLLLQRNIYIFNIGNITNSLNIVHTLLYKYCVTQHENLHFQILKIWYIFYQCFKQEWFHVNIFTLQQILSCIFVLFCHFSIFVFLCLQFYCPFFLDCRLSILSWFHCLDLFVFFLSSSLIVILTRVSGLFFVFSSCSVLQWLHRYSTHPLSLSFSPSSVPHRVSHVIIVFFLFDSPPTSCSASLCFVLSFMILFNSNISWTVSSTSVSTYTSVQSSFWLFVSLHVLYSVVCIYFSLVCQSITEFPFHWASCNLSRAFVTRFSAAFLNREDTGLYISSKSRPENIVAITVSGWYLTYYLIQIS